MGVDLDPEVQDALTRAALDLTTEGIAALLRGAIERREGRSLAHMENEKAKAAIRRHNTERVIPTVDELAGGAAQAGAGEVDEGEDGP